MADMGEVMEILHARGVQEQQDKLQRYRILNEKVKKLEKKLAQVESELSQKDNDTYRRQHTSFTK